MGIDIGSNIRNIRISNGETQQQLAEFLHVSDNAISRYENGHRIPDLQILRAIAKHYCTPLGLLINETIENDANAKITWQYVTRCINTLFPFISNKQIDSNPHFSKAKEYCLIIPKKLFVHGEIPNAFDYKKAEDELYIALTDDGILEAAAGLVWLRIFRFFLIQDFDAAYHVGKLLAKDSPLSKIRRCIIQHPESEVSKEQKQQFIDQYFDEIIQLIGRLKCSGRLCHIGDYYLGLLYLYGLNDFNLEKEYDLYFAIHHFIITAEMGNRYSQAFLSLFEEI